MKRKLSASEETEGKQPKVQKLSFETVQITKEDSSSEDDSSDDDTSDEEILEESIEMEVEEPADQLNITVLKDENNRRKQKHFISTPYMTKFEIAVVIGTRAEHIALGATVNVETHGETRPIEIAKMELKAQKLNMVVRRKQQDGSYEERHVRDLIIPDTYFYSN